MESRAPIVRVYDFRKPGPDFEVIRPIGPGQIHFVCLSHALWGCVTHYDPSAKRSFGCTGQSCICASRKICTREKGYLHILTHDKVEKFLELTPAAVKTLFAQIGSKEKSLRGITGWVRRSNGTIRGRIEMMIHERKADVDTLPAEKDPEIVLRALWGMDR